MIGTPGRIDDLLKRVGLVNTRELDILVLDEADRYLFLVIIFYIYFARLLEMGFEMTLNSIMNKLPKQRRTGLFSATMTDGLNELVRVGLRNPTRIVVKVTSINDPSTDQKTPASLEISYLMCKQEQKLTQLVHIIKRHPLKKFIVFYSTCACVDYFYKILSGLLKTPKSTYSSPQTPPKTHHFLQYS